jgi:hypothetical protein
VVEQALPRQPADRGFQARPSRRSASAMIVAPSRLRCLEVKPCRSQRSPRRARSRSKSTSWTSVSRCLAPSYSWIRRVPSIRSSRSAESPRMTRSSTPRSRAAARMASAAVVTRSPLTRFIGNGWVPAYQQPRPARTRIGVEHGGEDRVGGWWLATTSPDLIAPLASLAPRGSRLGCRLLRRRSQRKEHLRSLLLSTAARAIRSRAAVRCEKAAVLGRTSCYAVSSSNCVRLSAAAYTPRVMRSHSRPRSHPRAGDRGVSCTVTPEASGRGPQLYGPRAHLWTGLDAGSLVWKPVTCLSLMGTGYSPPASCQNRSLATSKLARFGLEVTGFFK